MSRRYLALAAGVAVIALALAFVGRPRPASAPPHAAPAPVVAEVTVTIADGLVTTRPAAVPVGRLVRLRVEHRGGDGTRLALAGYQDRLAIPPLSPGGDWSGEFLADRPGDDLPWLLDDRPAGRFAVTGSHLVEGHR